MIAIDSTQNATAFDQLKKYRYAIDLELVGEVQKC